MPIDREDLKQSLKVIKQAVKYLDEDQCSVGIYPEGTRNNTDDLILPCKAGSMKIAYLSKKPIVVMSVINTDKVVKNFILKRTHVYIRICEVIPYEDYKDLANAIMRFGFDKAYYQSVADACYARAKEFDISVMADNYLKMYRNIWIRR